ncbi:endonuclease domain-containing protein [Actinoplanes sp. HUAS TT8]|uniref:endonuclease domain-containing protein n=1 Tax=Actinoplanes sp. HUAS TT8 TaxID=3447453 RepID=UPI003F528A9D
MTPALSSTPDELTRIPFRGSVAIAEGRTTRGALRGSAWRRLLPDVYVHRDLPIDHRVWCAAVGLALPAGTAIGGPSAAHLWGAELLHPDPPVSVVAPRDRWTKRNRRIMTHHTVLAPEDLTVLSGVPITTPTRTAFDLGRRLSRTDAVMLIDAMLRERTLQAEAAAGLARQRPGWPGAARLRAVLSLADCRAESPMETRLRLLIHDAGIARPQPQFEVRDHLGRFVARVDLGWPAARVAAEYEGDHHRERTQFRRDVHRLNALRDAGWTVLRFTANDVLRAPHKTALTIATELARHQPTLTTAPSTS